MSKQRPRFAGMRATAIAAGRRQCLTEIHDKGTAAA